MSLPDITASAALDAQYIRPVHLIYLDVLGDPLRANTSGVDIAFSGQADTDLNHEFFGIRGDIVSVSPVKVASGGSGSVTVELSGLPDVNADLVALLSDRNKMQGRIARLWRIIRDADNVQQGGIQHYYTGYMMVPDIIDTRDSAIVRVTIESYLAAFSGAHNRTYLTQQVYDTGDLSATVALGIANGVSSNPATANTPAGASRGGGGSRDSGRNSSVRPF